MATAVQSAKTQMRRRPQRVTKATVRRNLEGWLFASPWIIGFVLWTLGPMLASLYLAFTEWDLVSSPKWVGLNNFQTSTRWIK